MDASELDCTLSRLNSDLDRIEKLATDAYGEFTGRLPWDGTDANQKARETVMSATSFEEAEQKLDKMRIERLAADAYQELSGQEAYDAVMSAGNTGMFEGAYERYVQLGGSKIKKPVSEVGGHIRGEVGEEAFCALIAQYESHQRLDLTGEAYAKLTGVGWAELPALCPDVEAIFCSLPGFPQEVKAQLPSLKVAHLGAEISPDAYEALVERYEANKRLDLTGEACSEVTAAGLAELPALFPEVEAIFSSPSLPKMMKLDMPTSFFFSGGKYWKWNDANDSFYPGAPANGRVIGEGFAGYPWPKCDSVVKIGTKAFMFCDGLYWEYNILTNRCCDGAPAGGRPIKEGWPGYPFPSVSAVYVVGPKAFMFYEDLCELIQLDTCCLVILCFGIFSFDTRWLRRLEIRHTVEPNLRKRSSWGAGDQGRIPGHHDDANFGGACLHNYRTPRTT
eukprot:COSAG01_NODE_1102_length_11682_cov_11.201848_8_plen_449_part_00